MRLPEIQHIQQPDGSKLCAHTCVAMALGISLDAACKRVGHRKATSNRALINALGSRAAALRSSRPPRDLGELPARCILRMQWANKRHHVVLKNGETVHDPLYSKPAPTLEDWLGFIQQHGGRLVSVIPLKEVRRG